MRLTSRPALIALLGAAVLGVAGCGGSDDGSGSSSPAKATSTAATTPAARSKFVTSTPGPEGVPLQLGGPLTGRPADDGSPKDGVKCNSTEQLTYHVHAHLAIFVNGKPKAVPLGIGIEHAGIEQSAAGPFAADGLCFYWLHTHATDGIVHIESPVKTDFTLGQFFAVWGQPLSASRVGPAKGAVTAYVNGKRVTGDPSDIVLDAHAEIQLDVGRPIVAPQPVTFADL